MKIERLYDDIAKTYNQKISGDVLAKANNKAFSLIKNFGSEPASILALGIGDGASLVPYKEAYPNAKLYGLDVSENMLQKAQKRLSCDVFHGDLADASSLIEKNNFDIILAHFVTAYVPLTKTLSECNKLLADDGMVSIVTNTMESFPTMQDILKKLSKSANPFNKLVGYHVNQALKTVYVPKNADDLKAEFIKQGFKLDQIISMEIEVDLKTEADVFEFFIEGGWFASGLVHPLLPRSFFHKVVKRLIHLHVPIPFRDSLHIAIAIGG